MNDLFNDRIDNLLIVDDNPQNLLLMQNALKDKNINIYSAQSGVMALKIIHNTMISMIIMDVNMPDLTGFDTAKIIHSSQASDSIPILFITSQRRMNIDIETGFELGAYDYIIRPIDIPLLRNKVRVFLKLHRTEQMLKQTNCLLEEKTEQLDRQLKEQFEVNNRLKFSEQVFENSVNGIIVVDIDLKFVRVNKAFSRITGYSPDELVGKTPKILSSGIQDKDFYTEMWDTLKTKGAWQGELWNRRKGQDLYAEMLSINAVKDEYGHVSHYIGIVTDITEKKRIHEKNEHLANYDFLTSLPNRLKLMTDLRQNIADPTINSLALLFLDLDKFKPVNDQYGHQVGDELLTAVAKRLLACVREQDIVVRLGGDEFIVVLKSPKNAHKAAEKVASKIIIAISSPFNLSDQCIYINTSIGIALYPEHGQDADRLITVADNAMYKSKELGAGCFQFAQID